MTKQLVPLSMVQGHLAEWVCRQHPYHTVDGVDVVNAFLAERAKADWQDGYSFMLMRWFDSWRELNAWLSTTLSGHSQMMAWNTPRKDSGATGPLKDIMFTSRYDTPKAEYDFIDLDALTRNIALSTWRECEGEPAADSAIATAS